MLNIIIWDENALRLHATACNLNKALQSMKLKASITYNSEPPLLDRMGLTGLTPVIEIDNLYWRYATGKEISFEQFLELLHKL